MLQNEDIAEKVRLFPSQQPIDDLYSIIGERVTKKWGSMRTIVLPKFADPENPTEEEQKEKIRIEMHNRSIEFSEIFKHSVPRKIVKKVVMERGYGGREESIANRIAKLDPKESPFWDNEFNEWFDCLNISESSNFSKEKINKLRKASRLLVRSIGEAMDEIIGTSEYEN